MQLALHGNIIETRSKGFAVHLNSYLVAENGRIVGIFDVLPERFKTAQQEDWGSALLLPALCDMHAHAPQYPMLGVGFDLPLLDWLDRYTFPMEARFSDIRYAEAVYPKFAQALIDCGTTRFCLFSSLHTDATLVLMRALEDAGLYGYVGKVNMDRNGTPQLEETTEESKRETLRWLDACKDLKHIKPILTPRFTPSCTDELMRWLGELAKERQLPVQSHLSENLAEMDWVHKLHPDCAQYWETYDKYGLFGQRSIMAHCVHCDARERKALKEHGVLVAHCADSNVNLSSGFAPVRTMLDEGVRVALGSDIAGGSQLCMLDVMTASIRASKVRRVESKWTLPFLTVAEAWHLGTGAAASFFGEKEGFSVGAPLHALVIDDQDRVGTELMSVTERAERAPYLGRDCIKAVYVPHARLK